MPASYVARYRYTSDDLRLRPSKAQLLECKGSQCVPRDVNKSFSMAHGTWYDVMAKLSGNGFLFGVCVVFCALAFQAEADIALREVDVQRLKPTEQLEAYVQEGLIPREIADLIGKMRPAVPELRGAALELCEQLQYDATLPYAIRRWVNLTLIWYEYGNPLRKLKRAEEWLQVSPEWDYHINLKLRIHLARITTTGISSISNKERLTIVDRLFQPILNETRSPRLDTAQALIEYVRLRTQCENKASGEWYRSDEMQLLEAEERRRQSKMRREIARAYEIQILRSAVDMLMAVQWELDFTPGYGRRHPDLHQSRLAEEKREAEDLLRERRSSLGEEESWNLED